MSTTPHLRDDDDVKRVLGQWLRKRNPTMGDVTIPTLERPEGAGGSNETMLIRAQWGADGLSHDADLVLRIAPTLLQMFVEPRFEEQYRTIEVLGQYSHIPVPAVRGFEADATWLGAPFWVMDRERGNAPADFPPYNQSGFLADATPDQRARLWRSGVETLAAVHRLPVEPFAFLRNPQEGGDDLDQLLSYWRRSLTWASDPLGSETLESLYDWLITRKPSSFQRGLSWGDARIGNMLFRDWSCVAVLDWEMVSLAGPMVDLAWWLLLDDALSTDIGLDRLPGLGTRADTLSLWEELTGLQVRDLEWYEALAGFRLGVILLRAVNIRRAFNVPLPAQGEFGSLDSLTRKLARTHDLPTPA